MYYCIRLRCFVRLIEWSSQASASMRAECLFLRARAFDKQLQKFCEHEQASTHLIFASNSSKGQILRALLNYTPFVLLNRTLITLLPVYSFGISDAVGSMQNVGCFFVSN